MADESPAIRVRLAIQGVLHLRGGKVVSQLAVIPEELVVVRRRRLDATAVADSTARPTVRMLATFREYCRTGSQKLAADEIGSSEATVKRQINALYKILSVSTALQCAMKLGWLVLPDLEHEVVALGDGVAQTVDEDA